MVMMIWAGSCKNINATGDPPPAIPASLSGYTDEANVPAANIAYDALRFFGVFVFRFNPVVARQREVGGVR